MIRSPLPYPDTSALCSTPAAPPAPPTFRLPCPSAKAVCSKPRVAFPPALRPCEPHSARPRGPLPAASNPTHKIPSATLANPAIPRSPTPYKLLWSIMPTVSRPRDIPLATSEPWIMTPFLRSTNHLRRSRSGNQSNIAFSIISVFGLVEFAESGGEGI